MKKPILRWKGLLAGISRPIRALLLVLFVTFCATLVFTQLGFAGIGAHGEYSTYAVVLLLPVALAALLFGTASGTLIGFIAGILLYVHAEIMPLNYYELTFVTPVSSIVMLAISGFLLGILFAFALRNDPPRIRRIIYIFIVCLFVSSLYTIGFVINALVSLFSYLFDSGLVNESSETLDSATSNYITSYFLGLGDLFQQALVDTLFMTVSCCIGDVIAQRVVLHHQGAYKLRTVFTGWLAAAVLFAFFLASTVGFIVITENERAKGEMDMRDEAAYLCEQINESFNRTDAFNSFLDATKLDQDDLDNEATKHLIDITSADHLLNGYSTDEDGVVLALYKDTIFLSNHSQYQKDERLSDIFAPDVCKAIEESRETGELRRVIYQEDRSSEDDGFGRNPRLGYLLVQPVEGELGQDYAAMLMVPMEMVYAERETSMLWMSLSFLALLLVVFLLVSRLLDNVVARDIDTANGVLGRVTAGDLDARVDLHNTVEFESLSTGINETVDTLKDWIAEAESRMDAELATAKEIQEAALPRVFPPYPDINRFDIYAMMDAAREIGGDFYDFFLIGDDNTNEQGKLCFLLADVSGKGVPAALFMMKAKTQLRDYIASGMELGEAVENANRQLCDGNDASMFVTAWVGVLDYESNHIEFVNAGHNPPLLYQDKAWRWVTERSGVPLGLFDGLPYKAFSLDCVAGDRILLYTDGVTEAMDVKGNLYGEEALMAVANENQSLNTVDLIETVRNSVAEHALGAEQSDDITILSLEVDAAPELTSHLDVPALVEELDNVTEFIHAELDRRLCPVRVQHQIDIAVEELFVNVAHYAYPEATPEQPGMAHISYTYQANPPGITIVLADEGIPYDPTAKPDAVTPDNIEDVPIGGLGILMAKRSVDEMSYEYRDGSNVVTIVKHW